MLHQQLGISPKARILLELTATSPSGAFIWDLNTGNTFRVVRAGSSVSVDRGYTEVPQFVQDIMAASDEDLKNRWLSNMGWDDVRETIFSELNFRGINILTLEGIS